MAARAKVSFYLPDEVGDPETVGLSGLSHYVGSVENVGLGAGDGVPDTLDHEVGNYAGVEVAGAHDHEVGFQYSLYDRWVDLGRGVQVDVIDIDVGADAPHIYAGLPGDNSAIDQSGLQVGVGEGHGQDATGDLQHASRLYDGKGHAAGDLGKGGKHEVAEAVSLKVPTAIEAVVEESAEYGIVGVVGAEAEEALTNVAGGELAELVAEAPGGTSTIGHGDDGCEVRRVVLQAVKNDEVAGAAADNDDFRSVVVRGMRHSGWDDKGVGQGDAMGDERAGYRCNV